MHVLRERTLLRAVEAVLQGRRLTLTDVARSWPDAERVRAPLKAFDRLLGNPNLQAEREPIHQEMAPIMARIYQGMNSPFLDDARLTSARVHNAERAIASESTADVRTRAN